MKPNKVPEQALVGEGRPECENCQPIQHNMAVVPYISVRLCPLHAATSALYDALESCSIILHNESGDHAPNFIRFEVCKQAPCVTARAALALARGETK